MSRVVKMKYREFLDALKAGKMSTFKSPRHGGSGFDPKVRRERMNRNVDTD